MKQSLATIAATAIVSLLGWWFFMSLEPEVPLDTDQTFLIVVVSAAIVLGTRSLWRYLGSGSGARKTTRRKKSRRQRNATS